jgi:cystathionine gamma-synthase
MKFETLAIHAGQPPDPITGAVMTPIYLSSTYQQDGVGKPRKGYEYSRTQNPTRNALQECLAELEAGKHGLVYASGMAAEDSILRLLKSGDHVLAGNDVYGGTFRLFDKVFTRFGINFDYVDTTDPETVADNIKSNTRLVWLETPTNPYLRISDINAIAELVHNRPSSPLLVVDNTFATPYLQRPLELGADIVFHSTTKYLSGHSDVIGGAIVVNDENLFKELAFIQNAVGAVPGAFDCFLILRGLKTLFVRMDRHAENASRVVEFLENQPSVADLYYPFHIRHPQHRIAQQQMRNGGGMISFTVSGGRTAAVKIAESTKIFSLAESLGGVESLIEVPASMTHLSTMGSPFEVEPGLIRLSVGIEHADDLIADLDQAIKMS